MKGVLATLGAVGVICLAGLRLCARVGDDVVSLASSAGRAATTSARYADDLSGARSILSNSVDDVFRGYSGGLSSAQTGEGVLDFVDAAGNVYENYNEEEKEVFWSDSVALSGKASMDQLQTYRVYQMVLQVGSRVPKGLERWVRADSLMEEVLALDSNEVAVQPSEQLLMALDKELMLGQPILKNTDSYVHRVFAKYFVLRQKVLQGENGDQLMERFDAVFLTPVPFVTLEQSYERALLLLEE